MADSAVKAPIADTTHDRMIIGKSYETGSSTGVITGLQEAPRWRTRSCPGCSEVNGRL